MEFTEEMLDAARPKFESSIEKAEEAYKKILALRDELMEYGWKGNASQNFYTNIATYIEQILHFKNHLDILIKTLEKLREDIEKAKEAASPGA